MSMSLSLPMYDYSELCMYRWVCVWDYAHTHMSPTFIGEWNESIGIFHARSFIPGNKFH